MIGRIVLSTVLIFALSSSSLYATDVSGDVWGEWNATGNPYNVVGDLRVPPGSTLVIGPGCYIEFQGYYQFLIDTSAVLQVLGTDLDSVYFTAVDTTTGWRGLFFNSADSSLISYGNFEYVKGNMTVSVIKNEHSHLTITGNSFVYNEVGDLINCGNDGPAIISDNLFAYNECETIIFKNFFNSLAIINNIFEYNYGVLIYTAADTSEIIGNIFRGNYGLVIFGRWADDIKFQRNLVYNNSFYEGPSVFVAMDAKYTIVHNTICNNISPNHPVGYFEEEHNGQPVLMVNNIFWGNTYGSNSIFYFDFGFYVNICYCDIQGGWPGYTNMNSDPFFADTSIGDFNLLANSPCIDAGAPNFPLDPDSTRADMGAFYFDQLTGIIQPPMLPQDITLYQNYPNPFNANTIIRFELPGESRVSIDIYDLLGRRVSSITDAYYRPGMHEILWDGLSQSGKQLPTGIYLYKLKSDTFEQTRKMMLLK
ncbi:MAG: T9SS type A sorting domain-containing protein [Candidatus Zixiibacteriota bacterium]|nr:MAG: T9SS type A sorting domain-containing protein [candidate division Zixibacteria bacterium]